MPKNFISKMWIHVVLASTLLYHVALAYTDPVYSPLTLNDSVGNVADNNSTIEWAKLPSGTPYKAGSITYDTGGFDPYYNLVNSFIGTVFSYGYPIPIIKGVQTGGLNYIISNYAQVVPFFIGYAICVVLGILFMIIFTLVGCFFCCCRCCGNCGGRKMQKAEDVKNKCKRNTFSFVMLILIIFSACGMTFLFVNNNRTSTAIDTLYSSISNNFDDINSYVNNTVSETKQIATGDVDFLISALTRDFDNIAYLVGIPIREGIDAAVNLTGLFASASSLGNALADVSQALGNVNDSLTYLKSNISALSTALNTTKTNIDTTLANCTNTSGCNTGNAPNTSGMALGIDSNSFPNISTQLQELKNAESQNLTQQIADPKNMFTTIPERVKNDSASTVQDLKSTLNQTKGSVKSLLDVVENLQNTFNGSSGSFDLGAIKDILLKYLTMAKDYNKYRWYGGIGLGCAILLIVLLQFLGLTCGVCGTDSGNPPTERGCLSNSGGNMLMASVGFIFIFFFLLMLLTTLTFIVGAPVKKFLCEPISTTDNVNTYIDGTLSDLLVGDNKYLLGGLLLQNNTIPITVSGLLSDCRDGGTIYTALQLNKMFNLEDMLNYSKYFNIDAELGKVNVNFSSINVYPGSLKTQLSELKSGVQINFTAFYDELNKSAVNANLSKISSDLRSANLTPQYIQDDLNSSADRIDNISNTEYQNTLNAVQNLKTALQAMEAAVSNIPTQVDNLMTGLNASNTYMQNNASTLVTSKIRTFALRLLRIADSFVGFVNDSVAKKLGVCTPIYNLYNSLLVISVCSYIMNTWNGFWFSLGWCLFFFVPSVIFAVKLAKHFRRMKYDEFYDDASTSMPKGGTPLKGNTDLSLPIIYRTKQNKVGHMDNCASSHGYPSFEHDSSKDIKNESNSSHSLQSNRYQSPDRILPIGSSRQDLLQEEQHEKSSNAPVIGCLVEQYSNETLLSDPSTYELFQSVANGEAPNATFESVKTVDSEW